MGTYTSSPPWSRPRSMRGGVVTDPHEIGNVAGVAGIEGLPLEVWVTVPSSVPSTPLETSGAVLGLAEIERLLAHPRVVGVAELMSFPAILAAEEGELEKVILAERLSKSPEGHAPTLTGPALQAYLTTGIASGGGPGRARGGALRGLIACTPKDPFLTSGQPALHINVPCAARLLLPDHHRVSCAVHGHLGKFSGLVQHDI
jgi:adenine deaminase